MPMKCPKCGMDLQDGVTFCMHCGAKVDGQPVPPPGGQVSPGGAPYQGGTPNYQTPYQTEQRKSPLVPILIVVLAAILVIGGILLYFLVLRGDDSSSSGDSSGGDIVADSGETPAPTDSPVATTEPTSEPTPSPTPTATPEPTPTPYGATLRNVNTDLKLDKKSSNIKIGKLKFYRMFNKKGKSIDLPVKLIVKTKRKSVGNRYKVYFDVTYKYMTNPKATMSLAPRIRNYADTRHYRGHRWLFFNRQEHSCQAHS